MNHQNYHFNPSGNTTFKIYKYSKKLIMAASTLVLIGSLISGCSSNQISIAKNADGLPDPKELIQLSAEQVSSLTSYTMEVEHKYQKKENDQLLDPFISGGKVDYMKEPFIIYTEQYREISDATSMFKEYISDTYGVILWDKGKWDTWASEEHQISYRKRDKLEYINPYISLDKIDITEMTVEQDGEVYVLHVTGEYHDQSSQEGYFDPDTRKEYTLVITKDQYSKYTYQIDKRTLLPQKLVKEIDSRLDYSGRNEDSQTHTEFTYKNFNKLNKNELVEGSFDAAKASME